MTVTTEQQEPQQKRARINSDSLVDTEILPTTDLDLIPLKVKRLSPQAKLPQRASAGAAGYDLCSAKAVTIPARGKALVQTDLSIAVPPGTYGRVAPRSGLAYKHHLDTGAGVVDQDYRGPLGVVMFNFGDTDYEVQKGDRIAQLVLERICTPQVIEVDDLDVTIRGEGGFGSTGQV